jgi:hypothetical protein
MKVLTLGAAAVLALGIGLAACSPSGERDDETSTTASDQAVDTGAMAPSDGSMTQPVDGTMGSEGTAPGTTGTNPGGTPDAQAPDDQPNASDTGTGTPPVQ